MGLVVGRLISGAVVVEAVFAIPGLGSLAIDAVKSHDYPTIQAVILLAVVMFVASNTAADIIHALIDPRVVTKQP
jgi:peptide/nickel transport system permease protein